MSINPDRLRGMTKHDVVRELVEHVVKSDEEIGEKETRGGRTTDLKVYVCDSNGFDFGDLNTAIERLVASDRVGKRERQFFDDHPVNEEVIQESISYVTITTPEVGREDDFIFVENDGYVWILTTERKKWVKRTLFKLISYLPSLERLYLSSQDLEELITGLGEAHVSGFTAKYHAPHRVRDATLRFHGAEEEDLATAKRAFNATPTRLEFDKANSPSTAIQGSESNDGEITLESVVEGSEPAAVETLLGLTKDYQERDYQNFEVEEIPRRDALDVGIGVSGFTAIELTEPDRGAVEVSEFMKELVGSVLTSRQYEYGKWGDDTLFVHDKKHSEVIEVALEPPDIVVYAQESTSSLSLRAFCKSIIDEFDSTYTLNKVSGSVVG